MPLRFDPLERCIACGGIGKVYVDRSIGYLPCGECNAPASPYSGMVPGGLAERAYRVAKAVPAYARLHGDELARRAAEDASRELWLAFAMLTVREQVTAQFWPGYSSGDACPWPPHEKPGAADAAPGGAEELLEL